MELDFTRFFGHTIWRAADAFRVTWSERVRPFVSDTSPKCVDREGLGRRRTGTTLARKKGETSPTTDRA